MKTITQGNDLHELGVENRRNGLVWVMEKGRDAVAIRVFIIVDNNKGRLLLRNDHDHVYSAVFVDVDKVN